MPARSNIIYQIQVLLQYSKPPIWRRVLVRSDTRLDQMHEIIQAVMGWKDSHLHQFIFGNDYYSYHQFVDFRDIFDSRKFKLNDFMKVKGDKLFYEYDFGDLWEHTLLLEKILEADPRVQYPTCIKGVRACPPENIGGLWGYYEFLEALANPEHDMHDEYIEWFGDGFDPEAFDQEGVKKQLESLPL
jgi:hypothetical protein